MKVFVGPRRSNKTTSLLLYAYEHGAFFVTGDEARRTQVLRAIDQMGLNVEVLRVSDLTKTQDAPVVIDDFDLLCPELMGMKIAPANKVIAISVTDPYVTLTPNVELINEVLREIDRTEALFAQETDITGQMDVLVEEFLEVAQALFGVSRGGGDKNDLDFLREKATQMAATSITLLKTIKGNNRICPNCGQKRS